MKWWQQQLSSNQWSYDTSQPPMVYTAKIGGKPERIVSVATMEGVWFAYNAATGAPIYQRVKVIDNVEHPNLKPGSPVAIYPSSLGGLELLARLLRSADAVRLQRRGGDRLGARPADLDPGGAAGAARR